MLCNLCLEIMYDFCDDWGGGVTRNLMEFLIDLKKDLFSYLKIKKKKEKIFLQKKRPFFFWIRTHHTKLITN